MDISYYEGNDNFSFWGALERKATIAAKSEDTQRRFQQFGSVVANKKWMDVGAGAGAVLDAFSPLASETIAVEPQEEGRQSIAESGYDVYGSVEEVPHDDIEVVTLFHVFEHLIDPIGTATTLRNKMSAGGKIVIEVPHAEDFLISFLDLEEFKSFTFWSEHYFLE
ncbi:class I SAM-dependent methyltransferase [Bremerella alba]|nr:class I SAM-dependent methyltransferase [Bremerella alba]